MIYEMAICIVTTIQGWGCDCCGFYRKPAPHPQQHHQQQVPRTPCPSPVLTADEIPFDSDYGSDDCEDWEEISEADLPVAFIVPGQLPVLDPRDPLFGCQRRNVGPH